MNDLIRKKHHAELVSGLNAIMTTGLKAVALTAIVSVPALAQSGTFDETGDKVCGFLGNINSILRLASIAVVTIAVIFAGYQIAFAHKRISDVAPILIGGLLIGAAGQIASMVIGDGGNGDCSASGTFVIQSMVNGLA